MGLQDYMPTKRINISKAHNILTNGFVVWGWDGVVAKRELARAAHVKWFDFMIRELNDDSLKQYIGSPDYFNAVLDITARFLKVRKDGNEELLSIVARNLYESFYLSESKEKERIWPGVEKVMEEINDEYSLENVIVSGTPNEAVRAIVNDENLEIYPSNILASRIMEKPKSKCKYLLDFAQNKPTIEFYIGDGVDDIKTAKNLGIYSVLAAWDKTSDYTGKFRRDEFEKASILADKIISSPEEILLLIP